MIYLLDTNMVSYIVKGRSLAAADRLLHLAGEDIGAISAITVAEIRYGLARRPDARNLHSLMGTFLASIRILSWGTSEAEAYGKVRAELEAKGRSLGNMDMMIAGHAIAARATLVTNDRAFEEVEQLPAIDNWATDL